MNSVNLKIKKSSSVDGECHIARFVADSVCHDLVSIDGDDECKMSLAIQFMFTLVFENKQRLKL